MATSPPPPTDYARVASPRTSHCSPQGSTGRDLGQGRAPKHVPFIAAVCSRPGLAVFVTAYMGHDGWAAGRWDHLYVDLEDLAQLHFVL